MKSPLSRAAVAAAIALVFGASPAMAALLGPSAYLSPGDSPLTGSFSYFHLENFEDNALNTPGVTANTGYVLGPSTFRDSVDSDDGSIDGSGNGGSAYYSGGATSVTFTFNVLTLGVLPTHVGIVLTDIGFASPVDGYDTVTFEAFDALDQSLGSLSDYVGDGTFFGQTAEDRFFGITYAGGIAKIVFSAASSGDLELDHLQYGAEVVPVPAAIWLMGSAIAGLGWLRRRQAAARPA